MSFTNMLEAARNSTFKSPFSTVVQCEAMPAATGNTSLVHGRSIAAAAAVAEGGKCSVLISQELTENVYLALDKLPKKCPNISLKIFQSFLERIKKLLQKAYQKHSQKKSQDFPKSV